MILQFYAKLLFWLSVMLNFSKFDFNGLDLFILLMHIPTHIISSTGYPHLHFLLLHN